MQLAKFADMRVYHNFSKASQSLNMLEIPGFVSLCVTGARRSIACPSTRAS